MYLVDTAVLINHPRGIETKNTLIFEYAETNSIPCGISSPTHQETLLGAKNQKEFDTLERHLSTQKLYHQSRKRGKTIRSSIHCLIMATAELEGLVTLSDDGNFKLSETIAGISFPASFFGYISRLYISF